LLCPAPGPLFALQLGSQSVDLGNSPLELPQYRIKAAL
jgi:hypothetical protein